MVKRIPTPHSYSAAVDAGKYVFIGMHRGYEESFAEQIHDTFTNLKKTLNACILPFQNLVKVHVYLKDIKDLPEMEKVFLEYFEEDKYPARMTSTTEFIDPDCLIMIEGIAYKG